MRSWWILVWLGAVVLFVYLWMQRSLGREEDERPRPLDELVKDPECQTYVARSRAVMRHGPEGARFFCSETCARRHLARDS